MNPDQIYIYLVNSCNLSELYCLSTMGLIRLITLKILVIFNKYYMPFLLVTFINYQLIIITRPYSEKKTVTISKAHRMINLSDRSSVPLRSFDGG